MALQQRKRAALRSLVLWLAAAAADKAAPGRGVLIGLADGPRLAVASKGEPALAYPARRLWRLDDDTALAFTGLAGDARRVANAAHQRCLDYQRVGGGVINWAVSSTRAEGRRQRQVFDAPIPAARLAADLGASFAENACASGVERQRFLDTRQETAFVSSSFEQNQNFSERAGAKAARPWASKSSWPAGAARGGADGASTRAEGSTQASTRSPRPAR